MKHPQKWRDTVDPWKLPYQSFKLTEIVGYPHAGNDVFHVKGIHQNQEIEAFIKVARQSGADIANEIATIKQLNCSLTPEIIDCDKQNQYFIVTAAKKGERLSSIVGNNSNRASHNYLYEYGRALASLHNKEGIFSEVKDRKFFHIPEKSYFEEWNISFVYDFLLSNQPQSINKCFCHGDFHYANILWHEKHISAILDFELSGIGNKEFDIAWAIILRPGQNFLNTSEEVSLFLEGYLSAGTCNQEYVKYYMVLIYSYFYRIGKDDTKYQRYIMNVFRNYCSHIPF